MLSRALAPFGLCVTPDGGGIEYAANTPAALDGAAAVLVPGVYAVLTGRPWVGCGAGMNYGAVRLDPAARLPPWVRLTTAVGLTDWHRVRPADRRDFPHLFADPTPAGRSRQLPSRPGPSRGILPA